MNIISTGKTTILSDFADFSTKYVYQHANGETTDFQLYQKQNLFVEVNKKSGLEILRVKEKPNQVEIQRVRKLNIDNVYCVACATQSLEEMALGLSNGHVRIYNYKNTEFVHRFNADNIRNGVLYLDYNASDEYMSAVYENGQINIFGLKTKAKIETVNIDGNSTMSRFHPTKRFQLAVASYKGSVTLYDVQTKRKIYNSIEAHVAPCQDLCMCAATPDTLVSVGYDCVINIFDIRRKTQPKQLRYCYPLSTAALSECGTFLCVGNLKGELISYDMRNTQAPLMTRKVHDTAVTRVGFLPSSDEKTASFLSNSNQTAGSEITTVERQSNRESLLNADRNLRKSLGKNMIEKKTEERRDSFCDFLDFQAQRGLERVSSRFITQRDSFDWDQLGRKVSIDGHSQMNIENNGGDAGELEEFDAFINTRRRKHSLDANSSSDAAGMPLRDRSNISRVQTKASPILVQIEEEQLSINTEPSDCSDKENPHAESDIIHSHIHLSLPANCKSTPNRKSESVIETHVAATEVAIDTPPSAITHTVCPINVDLSSLTNSISELRSEMNERFHQLEMEIKINAESNKWHVFTQNHNLWLKQMKVSDEIGEAVSLLLHNDPFLNEFSRLREENEYLRSQLQQVNRKNSN